MCVVVCNSVCVGGGGGLCVIVDLYVCGCL